MTSFQSGAGVGWWSGVALSDKPASEIQVEYYQAINFVAKFFQIVKKSRCGCAWALTGLLLYHLPSKRRTVEFRRERHRNIVLDLDANQTRLRAFSLWFGGIIGEMDLLHSTPILPQNAWHVLALRVTGGWPKGTVSLS